MIVYSYDPETGEYLGIEEAQESPLEPGVYLLPAHSTLLPPPLTEGKELPIFINNEWVIMSDHRGETWYDTITKEACEVKTIEVPSKWTPQEPLSAKAEWNGTAWILPLSVRKKERMSELENSFNTRVSGSILITPGKYIMQFDTLDSLKMQGAIQLLEATGQTEGYLTQADDTTIYHVPLETLKAVLVCMLGAYAQCHARKQKLRALINAAQTEEELDAIEITWPV